MSIASNYHAGMTDKYGHPYFEHLEIRVADRVREMEYDMVDETSEISLCMVAAAYLHDVIEDTEFDRIDLIEKFGEIDCRSAVEVVDLEILEDDLCGLC